MHDLTGRTSQALARWLAVLTTAAAFLAIAAPVIAQEAGHAPVPVERKLVAVAILVAFLALMIAWAWLYRRVNRA